MLTGCLRGAAIKVAILVSKKSLAQVAEDCGWHYTTLSRKIYGRRGITFADIAMIAEATGVDVDWLTGHCAEMVAEKAKS